MEQLVMPRHVAIIMDGNGRWATKRLLPRIAGHKRGVDALKRIIRVSGDLDINTLTVFAFSSENWSRPAEEVRGLMRVFTNTLGKELGGLARDRVRLCFLGDRSRLPEKVLASLESAEQLTCNNNALRLNVCFSYGGRWDIVSAARRLAEKGESITEESLAKAVTCADCGYPDLIIRTGGEMRLSNFLLWQAAYSELYFSDCLWPDFGEKQFRDALVTFASRERRFGCTSEQIQLSS